jgi:hypothetical protein
LTKCKLNRNLIGDLEEQILYAMQTKDRTLFSQVFKEYIITLGKREEFGKLKSLLINRILYDENSTENVFFRQLAIPKYLIYQNAVNLLKNINGCKPLWELLEVAVQGGSFQ